MYTGGCKGVRLASGPCASDRLIFSGGNAERTIQQAISDFHKKTCIRFVHSTGSDYYIRFIKGHGCVFFILLTMMRSD